MGGTEFEKIYESFLEKIAAEVLRFKMKQIHSSFSNLRLLDLNEG